MPLTFKQLNQYFVNNDFSEIENDLRGARFLKLRSISRKSNVEEFALSKRLEIRGKRASVLFEEIFDTADISNESIDAYINEKYLEERKIRRDSEDHLVEQLNKLQVFEWGGAKSVEKNIVDNYVKKIVDYNEINEAIEGSILSSLRGYTLNSWYNHWTSILIEDLFKDHDAVLPTVGLVKKVDFFINEIPFDLKVTYFPEQLMKEKLKESNYGVELTRTKKVCRSLGIQIPKDMKADALKNFLQGRLREHQSEKARKFLSELKKTKLDIIAHAKNNPNELKVWLYENQGEMRFDASNRFFLILVNESNLTDSWKLKRNIEFLRTEIQSHLSKFQQHKEDLLTKFYWQKDEQTYQCKSDILFINFTENL